MGSELARLLSSEGHNVVVIDRNRAAFDRLGSTFNGLTVAGNGFSLDLLKQIEIEKADAFCAVTNGDNTNLVSAQVAKKIFRVPKVIARVYDPQRAHIYTALGLDIISGTILFASMLRDKIIESRFSSYLIESKELGILELDVSGDVVNKTAGDVSIPGVLLVAAVRRLEGVFVADSKTVLKDRDVLMAVVKVSELENIRQKFGLKE